MNKNKNIFKSLLILTATATLLSCSVEPEDIDIIELGSVNKEYEVEAEAGSIEVEVYSSGECNIGMLEPTSWVRPGMERIVGDGKFSVEYDANDSFARVAHLLLTDNSGLRRDTVYIRQKGVIEEKLAFPTPNISVKGSVAEDNCSTAIDTNIEAERLSHKIVYPDGAEEWISNIRIEDGKLLFATTANADVENRRSAEITISFTNGWDKTTSAKLYVVQANANDNFGVEKSFEEIREMCGPNSVVTIDKDYYITAYVVSDTAGGNMGENLMTTESTINYNGSKKTAYLESEDGKYGFLVETTSPENNIFVRYSKVQLILKGLRLTHDTEPDRFALKGVEASMIISSVAGEANSIPQKEKYISQLTDDDLYTYVGLLDCELPIRKGPLTPINEGYANATGANRTEKSATIVRDIEGNNIYLYTNTTCMYRRDGSRLPYGSGTIKGIIVHELFKRFEYEDNESGDDESYGNIGRYQLRHVSKSDFDGLSKDFTDSFSALLTEYRFMQFDNGRLYPTYGDNGYLTKSDYAAVKMFANEDFSYLGPVGNKATFIFGNNQGNKNGMGIIVDNNSRYADGTDLWRDFANVNSNTSTDTAGGGKGKCPPKSSSEGPAWCAWHWWDANNERGYGWVAEFSTEGISTDVISMQVSVLNDRYSSGQYVAPRYFDVAWSETGDVNNDNDWHYIASYTVPDMARWTPASRVWQYAGWKPIDIKLPLEILGKPEVYIRMQNAKPCGGNLESYAQFVTPIDGATCMNYFAIRYNK